MGGIFSKRAWIYLSDKFKSWLDFADLGLIFKATGGLKYVKFFLYPQHLLHQHVEIHQTYMNLSLRQV